MAGPDRAKELNGPDIYGGQVVCRVVDVVASRGEGILASVINFWFDVGSGRQKAQTRSSHEPISLWIRCEPCM